MTKLYFTQTGQGTMPAVFLHGLWGGGNYFRELDLAALPLGPSYFPDEVGFGASPKPDITYTPQTHCQAIFDILHKGQSYTLVGHSFGTVLAAYFATLYPNLVKRLILISPIIYSDVAEAKQYLSTTLITRLTVQSPFVAQLICRTMCSTGILGMVSPLFVRGLKRRHISGCTQHTWHSYYSSFVESLLKEPLAPTFEQAVNRAPTLLLYGEKDRYVAHQTLEKLTANALVKNRINGETHSLLFNRYADCLEEISSWLSANT